MPNYQVYYQKDPYTHARFDGTTEEKVLDIVSQYVPVMRLWEENLDDVYFFMQGENWSPNGEARQAIQDLGLSHTSMMIGDVIEDLDTGEFFMVNIFGFSLLTVPENVV
jgi:hypothetical protein